MGENSEELDSAGVNDQVQEPGNPPPAAEQGRSIGDRRRDAEAKLEQHLRDARSKETEADGQQQ
ncbi:hypothetical protein [Pseudarthrobacter sp. B4EP4b]|jgi:hypothetical protein|uniref:hypothetical protein n=1 Tax=Pseudarthrobacter sp. B4EP4b TaxID=2590664 RepID=UPI0008C45E8E|nr:hypothetical protein [Pseudarthrobacter sp. B4EP4b]SEQ02075.1 hypothetical protein SAMN05444745_103194 [Arthrobacter sp. OV608]